MGDQFAMLEAIVALAVVLQHLTFELIPDQNISMTTGATIHTANVILLTLWSWLLIVSVYTKNFGANFLKLNGIISVIHA